MRRLAAIYGLAVSVFDSPMCLGGVCSGVGDTAKWAFGCSWSSPEDLKKTKKETKRKIHLLTLSGKGAIDCLQFASQKLNNICKHANNQSLVGKKCSGFWGIASLFRLTASAGVLF